MNNELFKGNVNFDKSQVFQIKSNMHLEQLVAKEQAGEKFLLAS